MIISYNGEAINLAHVVWAKHETNDRIKVCMANAIVGNGSMHGFKINKTMLELDWPYDIWKSLCEKAGVIFGD